MQLQQYFQASDGRLAIRVLEFLKDARLQQKLTDRINQLIAPQLVGVAGRRADHGQVGSHEPAAHQTLMVQELEQIEAHRDRHDGL